MISCRQMAAYLSERRRPSNEMLFQGRAPARHRDPDTGRLQASSEGEARELAALVGLANHRLVVWGRGVVERVSTETCIQRFG